MATIGSIHGSYVFPRRVRRLCEGLARLMPADARVLDVGCGDGNIDRILMERRPDLTIEGIDVLVRPNTHITVKAFDGVRIPHDKGSFDVVSFVDVLHHTPDPKVLLAEAARVSRRWIVIKDHNKNGWLSWRRLAFMDYVGNARFGVSLPYNYWTREQWRESWKALRLTPVECGEDLRLYPWPADIVFGGTLHFLALLEVGRAG